MPSSKERQRWERWYDMVTERMQRQKDSITRLVLINTECVAALHEIAEISKESHRIAEWEDACARASVRAQEALDRIGAAAAAENQSVEESEAEPIPDPRSNR